MEIKRSPIESLAIYTILIVGCLIMAYPFIFQVLASLGSTTDYYKTLIVPIPTSFHIDRYITVFSRSDVYIIMRNTFIRCAWGISLTILYSLTAGYVFSKLRFRGRDTVFLIFLSSIMIPGQVTLIPTYLIYAKWPLIGGNDWFGQGGHGMLDSWWVLLFGGIPVGAIFLMKQMLHSLPFEYEEAARVDGAGVFRTIFGIYLPMVKPVISVLTITTFTSVWNDLLWPLVSTSSPNLQVIGTGMAKLLAALFIPNQEPHFPDFYAVATIAILPPIIVYLLLQKSFVQGFAMTGVKG